MTTDERLDPTQDEVNGYLDDLRESGVTNMFGALPYLMENFDITAQEASTLLAEWMRTYGERHPR